MIVIGGSLGGCEALCEILQALPANFPSPIAVVLHRHKDSEGMLLPIIQQKSALLVSEVQDKDPIEGGKVYVCPPDYHLLIDDGFFSLSTDEPVNFARPSIDVLLESAAECLGDRTIAVILSGASSDGAKAAKIVVDRGGVVIVQSPESSQSSWMPSNAITSSRTKLVLRPGEIAAELVRLAQRP